MCSFSVDLTTNNYIEQACEIYITNLPLSFNYLMLSNNKRHSTTDVFIVLTAVLKEIVVNTTKIQRMSSNLLLLLTIKA